MKPNVFSDVVTRDLESESRDKKRRAVEKFSTFWKLATKKKTHRG